MMGVSHILIISECQTFEDRVLRLDIYICNVWSGSRSYLMNIWMSSCPDLASMLLDFTYPTSGLRLLVCRDVLCQYNWLGLCVYMSAQNDNFINSYRGAFHDDGRHDMSWWRSVDVSNRKDLMACCETIIYAEIIPIAHLKPVIFYWIWICVW